MSVYSTEEKSFSTPWWKEYNAINLSPGGWLISQSVAANPSLKSGPCCWHNEDSVVVMARSALVRERLVTGPVLSIPLCQDGGFVIECPGLALRELGKEDDWHPQDSHDFTPMITDSLQHSGTFCCTFTWDPMRANSEFHSYNSSSNLFATHLFPLISLKI